MYFESENFSLAEADAGVIDVAAVLSDIDGLFLRPSTQMTQVLH
jgi:hypothetical protein